MTALKEIVKKIFMFISALMLIFSAGLLIMNIIMIYRLIERTFS